MTPCLAPILDEGFERAALNTVGEVGNSGADNFVAAADCEGLEMSARSRPSGCRLSRSFEQFDWDFYSALKSC